MGLAVVLLLVAAFTFYWFEWRPTQIKKDCYKKAERDIDDTRSGFDRNYNNCLREKGISE